MPALAAPNPDPCAGAFEEAEDRPPPINPPSLIRSRSGTPLSNATKLALQKRGYEIVKTLGSGFEGTTFQAKKDGHLYAIKVPHEGREGHLRAEATLLERARVGKDGTEKESHYFKQGEIVDLEAGGGPVLIQRFAPRKPGSDESLTLADRLDRENMPDAMREKVLDQVLDAMEIMHERGAIHRDLKPANILVDDEGNVHIIDFGIGAEKGKRPFGLTSDKISGTPRYMSKNQFASGNADPADDGNAFRKLAWEVLTNQRTGTDGSKAEQHTFQRRIVGTLTFPDHESAPEHFTSRPYALAIWSQIPKTAKERKELIQQARSLPKNEFYLKFGERLKALPTIEGKYKDWLWREQKVKINIEAAREILASRELIARFPEGLGLTRAQQDEIIRGFFVLEGPAAEKRKSSNIGPIDDNPHLLFAHFRAKVTELQGKRKAGSDRSYKLGLPKAG